MKLTIDTEYKNERNDAIRTLLDLNIQEFENQIIEREERLKNEKDRQIYCIKQAKQELLEKVNRNMEEYKIKISLLKGKLEKTKIILKEFKNTCGGNT